MLYKGIVATTKVDLHNTRIEKEALESAVYYINNSGFVPSVSIEHDRTIMPLGKVISAELLPIGNGEYKMETTQEVFENKSIINMERGLRLVSNKSDMDRRPFVEDDMESEYVTVIIDPMNFENQKDMYELREIVESYNGKNGMVARKALIPDPEIIFRVSQNIMLLLLSKPVMDTIGVRVANKKLDEIEKFKSLVFQTIKKYSKMVIHKNRPQTYVFKMVRECNIELVIVTTSASQVMDALSDKKMCKINNKVLELKKYFEPARIQFLYENEEWVFNYLCTNEGEVIGTEKSYKKQVKEFNFHKEKGDKMDVSINMRRE